MRLYIIRHGETAWNRSMRLQGQTDIELNENGRLLAKVTARAFRPIPFDLCFTSPLIRAKETAQIVLGDRKIPVFEEARIQEISFGVFEGRSREKDQDCDWKAVDLFFRQPDRYAPPEGGESLDDLCARTGSFLDEIAGSPALFGKTILVSTHGAASRALLAHIKGSPRSQFWGAGVPKNCAVTIVDLISGQKSPGTIPSPNWVIREQDVVYYENV